MSNALSPFWHSIWSNTERESLLLSCPALMAFSFEVVMKGLQNRQAERDAAKWKQMQDDDLDLVVLQHDHGGGDEDDGGGIIAAEEDGEGEHRREVLLPPFPDPLRNSRRVRDQVHVLLSCLDTSELMSYIFPDLIQDEDEKQEKEERSETHSSSSSSSSNPKNNSQNSHDDDDGVHGMEHRCQHSPPPPHLLSPSSLPFWKAMRYAVECLWHCGKEEPKSRGEGESLSPPSSSSTSHEDGGGDNDDHPRGDERKRGGSVFRKRPREEEKDEEERAKGGVSCATTITTFSSSSLPLFSSHWLHYIYPSPSTDSSSSSPSLALSSFSTATTSRSTTPQLVFALPPDHFSSSPCSFPLPTVSFFNAVRQSEKVLRLAISAALSASVRGIPPTMKGLSAVLLLSRIVQGGDDVGGGSGGPSLGKMRPTSDLMTRSSSPTTTTGSGNQKPVMRMMMMGSPARCASTSDDSSQGGSITGEGLNFCMLPMAQQWWVLLQAALDRLFLLQRVGKSSGGGAATGEDKSKWGGRTVAAVVTKTALWQRLGILAMMEPTLSLYPFPSKEEDLVSFLLLVRLSEIGLIYPMKLPPATNAAVMSSTARGVEAAGGGGASTRRTCSTLSFARQAGSVALSRGMEEEGENSRKCFVISPYLRHALQWGTASPLCATSLLIHSKEENIRENEEGKSGTGRQVGGGREKDNVSRRSGSRLGTLRQLKQQELDTIITETNYRLYVYSVSPDLLRLVGMFAEQEEVINGGVLTCFRITRNSFAEALHKGLTASEILQFLSSKAHPSMVACYGETTLWQPPSSSSDGGGGASLFLPGAGEGIVDGVGDASDDAGDTIMGAATALTAASSHTLVLPPSIVDQLLMWEREQHRVVFQPHVVLLQDITPEQKKLIHTILQDYGESDGLIHEEIGVMILREDVYDRLLEQYISTG